MITGLAAGVFWALDTVILGVALAMTPFISDSQAVFLAPFVSTFLHDFFSTIWMFIYMGFRKQYKNVIRALKTRSGKFIVLGALMGGPIGMSGYVTAIHLIGPAYTAIISALFPALGALFAYIFLKEKMKISQIVGLLVSIGGVIIMGYSPSSGNIKNVVLGFGAAILCCVGWASEAVICAYGMKDPDINNEHALQIRQLSSTLFYGIVILTLLGGWGFTLDIAFTKTSGIILLSALFGTASYLCYYKAISTLGASKAMALNITYSAWSIVFALVLLHTLPDVKSVICGIIIVGGSIVAGADIKEIFQRKKVIS
ncbi:MAG TPA: DMT family transporter [Candidatus Merdenecus merdavium]|nr:DMT family transporter [Candidatus Merdenecus merdavium]